MGRLAAYSVKLTDAELVFSTAEELFYPGRERAGKLFLRVWNGVESQKCGEGLCPLGVAPEFT